jgi:hypothetical protein
MTRGDQRNRDRAAAQARQAEKDKGHRADGLSRAQAVLNDAEIMRKKQEAALAKKAADAAGSSAKS